MEKHNNYIRFKILSLMILLAAFCRLLPHPSNFAPIGAMTIFGIVYYSQKIYAFLVPAISMVLSDIAINNTIYAHYFDGFTFIYPGSYFTYIAFIIIGISGYFILKKINYSRIVFACLLSSIIFFLVSNFGIWAYETIYPKNIDGLLACYISAIPFLKNTIMGDLMYSGIMFGVFEYVKFKYPTIDACQISWKYWRTHSEERQDKTEIKWVAEIQTWNSQ